MIFVNHIISHRKLGKALDLLALVGLLAFLFLMVLAENIALGDHHKFDQRIFKAPVNISAGCHDLPRLRHPVHILRIKGCDTVFREICRQPLGSCPGTRQKNHPVALFFPAGQIFHQKLEAVVVGIDASYGHAELVHDLKMPSRRLQRGEPQRMMFGKP